MQWFSKRTKRPDSWIPEFDVTRSIFIHTPKAAGTSIAMALYQRDPWHYPIEEYRYLPASKFDAYFKFSFIRNPFDRVLSTYLYSFAQVKRNPSTSVGFVTEFPSFKEFVTSWLHPRNVEKHYFFKPQISYVFGKNGRAVDFIGRFETLEEDYEFVRYRLGVSGKLKKKTQHDMLIFLSTMTARPPSA